MQPKRRAKRRDRSARLAVTLATLVGALSIAVTAEVGADARPSRPPRINQFLWGLAGQESGWNYYARNRWSGAYGKYQIMPFNWPSWAGRFLGNRWADQTPWNQEIVARRKVANLYRWLGSWPRVAYWWLTGDDTRNPRRWSRTARRYVHNVMLLMDRAPRRGSPMPRRTTRGPRRGDWRVVGKSVRLRRFVGAHRGVGWVRGGTVVRVARAAWERDRGRLWMRIETASGRVGWTTIRATMPARRPANARRWRDNDRNERPRIDRRRARPRPR
jgi:hypothetical protein